MSIEEKSLKLEVIAQIPKSQKQHSLAYNDILNEAKSSKARYFKVNVGDRKVKSVYVALTKRLKEPQYKVLKIHLIANEIYLEKEKSSV